LTADTEWYIITLVEHKVNHEWHQKMNIRRMTTIALKLLLTGIALFAAVACPWFVIPIMGQTIRGIWELDGDDDEAIADYEI
jgi:uncharacterized membrane protein YbhN (UPF0104 family)